MADETTNTASVDAPETNATVPTTSDAPEPAPETNGEAEVANEDEQLASKQATSEVNGPDGETTDVAAPPVAGDEASTPATNKKEKRKSTSVVPEHKSKALKKKKSMPNLHLDCKPGDYYWARLKGYPPWPAIICDEQMLPESLLGSRPVSTTRPDGSLRDDFKEGGKNARDRTFAVMFLHTNEFSWIINTALTPLDPEECKAAPKTKMTKQLTAAYELAAENNGIEYFKDLLKQWLEEEKAREEELQAENERHEAEKAAAAAEEADGEKKAEKKKKAPRKSKAADEDVEMDVDEAPKSNKKRKKDAESDTEGKPKKTPKVTKITVSKTPNGEASTKKSKKKVAKPDDDEVEQPQQMSDEERMAAREKAVLYLRHRLQKGFLSRDQAPLESEMGTMAEFFTQLENYENLEVSILKKTKIHKVLRGIVKLTTLPKDDEFNFKKRSSAMLDIWNVRMDADTDGQKSEAPETNGEAKTLVADGGEASVESEAKEGAEEEDKAVNAADQIEEKIETSAAADEEITKPAEDVPASNEKDHEGDVSMQTAPEAAAADNDDDEA